MPFECSGSKDFRNPESIILPEFPDTPETRGKDINNLHFVHFILELLVLVIIFLSFHKMSKNYLISYKTKQHTDSSSIHLTVSRVMASLAAVTILIILGGPPVHDALCPFSSHHQGIQTKRQDFELDSIHLKRLKDLEISQIIASIRVNFSFF